MYGTKMITGHSTTHCGLRMHNTAESKDRRVTEKYEYT